MQEQNSKPHEYRLTWPNMLAAISAGLIGVGSTEFLIAHFAAEMPSWVHPLVFFFWIGAAVSAACWIQLGRAPAMEAVEGVSTMLLGAGATFAAGEFFSLQLSDTLVVLLWCAIPLVLFRSPRTRILNHWRRLRTGGKNPQQEG